MFVGINANIYTPNTVEKVSVMDGGVPIISKNSNNLITINSTAINSSEFMIADFFYSLVNAENLENLSLIRTKNINFISLSKYFYNELPSIIKLDLSGLFSMAGPHSNILESLDGIENFTNLESLTVNFMDSILDISAIKNCNKLTYVSLSYGNIQSLPGLEYLLNLKTLVLNNNNITGVKELENLTNLTSLNLENNLISDTASYINEAGETVTYNNLEILANLNSNRNGKLTTLLLSGNSNIINFSPVSSLTWSSKSGF